MDEPSAKSTLNEVWPKPRLPSNDEFLGVITNIDSEGQVYIQNEIGEKVTEGMSKILTEIHSKFPRREDNLKWLPGKNITQVFQRFLRGPDQFMVLIQGFFCQKNSFFHQLF